MSFIRLNQVTKQYTPGSMPAVDQFNLEVEQGEIITLLGPSGCGKTTTLRMIAGFEQLTSGEIYIADELLCNESFALPPEKRGIGMVFQDYALFPNKTVAQNIMFGLVKWSSRDKKERAREVLDLVGLPEYADRYPHELSGGQQQRVALARALAPRPKVILMDEPFSNLDAGLRERMASEVNQIIKKSGTTAIIVTHDQKDAFSVSDRIVVMNEGKIQQIDSPKLIYRCPANCFVAQFLGKTNLLTGTLADDLKHVYTNIGKVCLPEKTKQLLDTVTLSIRPEACQIVKDGKYFAEVERVIYKGEYQEVLLRIQADSGDDLSLTIHAQIHHQLSIGEIISFDITPELVSLVN